MSLDNRPASRRDAPMSTHAIPPRAIVMLGALTILWGTNWTLFPYAVQEISVWTFRSVVLGCAGLLLMVVARLRGDSLAVPRKYWSAMAWATGSFIVVWNVAGTYAALLIPSGQAAVLGFTMPLWSALIAWAVLGERPGQRLLLAIAVTGGGVLLLMLPGFSAYADAPLGFALGLLAGLGWAVGTLVLQRGAVQLPVLVLTAWQLLLGVVPIGIAALVLGDHHWFMPSWQTIAVVSWITLVPMCIGNVCWFAIVGLLPANVAGLSSVLVPVVAMVSGAIVHAEPLGPLQLVSMALCVSGLVLALGQKKK